MVFGSTGSHPLQLASLQGVKIQHNPSSKLDLTLVDILQIIFYIIFIIKIINLSFFATKKLTIKERIIKKYRFSYKELVNQFNEEEEILMRNTLNNTIKNTSVEHQPKTNIKASNKKVNFSQRKNSYYQPQKKRIDEEWNDEESQEDQERDNEESDGNDEEQQFVCNICTENDPGYSDMVTEIQSFKRKENVFTINSLLDQEQQQQPFNFSAIQSLDDSLEELENKLGGLGAESLMEDDLSREMIMMPLI